MRAVASAAAASILILSAFGATSVSAGQPNWDLTVTTLPNAVSPGADAGYRLVIRNNGSSNISKLFLNDTVAGPATYLAGDRANTCQTSPVLFCSFGALGSGGSITLTVAHATPASGASFSVTFELNTSGASANDKGHTSHGDTLTRTATTSLSGDQNFGGGFVQSAGSNVSNGQTLSGANVQSTKVTVDATNSNGIPVTVQDGSAVTFPCVACSGTVYGEWSDVQVAEGANVSGLIKLTLTVYKGSLPKKVDLSKVVVFHTYIVGATNITDRIQTACPATPIANCLTPTKLSNGNLEVVVYVDHNGGFKPGLR
jgi:hypothetical protein